MIKKGGNTISANDLIVRFLANRKIYHMNTYEL